MKAQFKFLAGGRAGTVETSAKAYIGIGRHPLSDIRFDTERDLDVSTRHAAVVRRGDAYIVQDLNSKNGTFVNGKQITGDTPLADGDVIGFGKDGPALEFHAVEKDVHDPSSPSLGRVSARESRPREMAAQHPGTPARSSTAVRIAAEVARQTAQLRNTTKILFLLLLVVAGGFGFFEWKNSQATRDLEVLQHRADSLNQALAAVIHQSQNQIQAVRDALTESRTEVEHLRTQLDAAGASGDVSVVTRLRAQLDGAIARQQGLTNTTGVDYRAIAHANQDAVALVIVEFADGDRVSGTAFAIDSQGSMITNKHVLAGDDGTKTVNRIAVKFSGSKQWFPGHFVAVADSADLGLIKVEIKGGTPRVAGIERDPRSLERGDPIAILGYPLGLDLPMEGQGMYAVASPTLTVGTTSKVLTDLVQVDGFGAPGSSGSPIFNRNGRVVAVLYGGERESNGKIIFSVPAAFIYAFLSKQGIALR